MKSFSTRALKQSYAPVIDALADGPVALTRYGRRVAVVLAPEDFDGLLALREAARANTLARIVDELEQGRDLRLGARRLLNALRGASRAGR